MFKTDNLQHGILLSGGLDSAILLAMLCKNNTAIQIQPFTIPKTDGAALYVNAIIDYVNQKFGTQVPHAIFVGNPSAHHTKQSYTAVVEIFSKHKIDKLFNAINPVPQELAHIDGAPQRNFSVIDSRLVFPFSDMLKDKVLSLMYEHELEDLIEITHSCTELQMTRCRQCWQCQERAWAFSRLNKLDKGTF